jgi:hypothetical protein
MKVAAERSILVAVILLAVGSRVERERSLPAGVQRVPTLEQEDFMKQIVGFIVLAFLQLMVACSSVAPWETRQWQPTAVNDFESVAGKWEGLLSSNDPRVLNFDRATLVIDDTGACESAITRTRTKVQGMSVSYDVIDMFAEKGKLVLTDGKLSTKFEKGGQLTVQLYVDPASGERMLKAEGKNSQGFTYSADLKRTGDLASAK